MSAAAPRRHPDHLDGVGFEQIDLPPGADFFLRFGAPPAVVLGALFAVVGVSCTAAPHRGRLIGGLPKGYVRP